MKKEDTMFRYQLFGAYENPEITEDQKNKKVQILLGNQQQIDEETETELKKKMLTEEK